MATRQPSSPDEILAHLAHSRGSNPFRPDSFTVPGVFAADLKQTLQVLKLQGYADTRTEWGDTWWITGAGLTQAQHLNPGDAQPSPPHPLTPARYATTIWDLHLASFRYQALYVFPEDIITAQTALVVRTWPEAEILINAVFPKGCGGVLRPVCGKDMQGRPVDKLEIIHPWIPGAMRAMVQDTHALEITLAPDRSNLDELAFQVHREFDFVADILHQLYTEYARGSQIMAGQFRAHGWAAIPGFREAHGHIGRLTSPPPDDDGSFRMDPQEAIDLGEKFLGRSFRAPRPGESPLPPRSQGPPESPDNPRNGGTP